MGSYNGSSDWITESHDDPLIGSEDHIMDPHSASEGPLMILRHEQRIRQNHKAR